MLDTNRACVFPFLPACLMDWRVQLVTTHLFKYSFFSSATPCTGRQKKRGEVHTRRERDLGSFDLVWFTKSAATERAKCDVRSVRAPVACIPTLFNAVLY